MCRCAPVPWRRRGPVTFPVIDPKIRERLLGTGAGMGGGSRATGLETAAARAAHAGGRGPGGEGLTARTKREQRGKDLSELIQFTFTDRFAQRKLERQLADIADSVEQRLATPISVEYGGPAENDRAAVFAEVTLSLERADLSDAALLRADADPVKLARRIRTRMPSLAGQLGEAGSHLYGVVLDECCDC